MHTIKICEDFRSQGHVACQTHNLFAGLLALQTASILGEYLIHPSSILLGHKIDNWFDLMHK